MYRMSIIKYAPHAVLYWSFFKHCLNKDITKTRLFKYTENFTTKKWKLSDKNTDIFHVSAQNTDCEYSFEPHHWGSSNEYHLYVLSRNKKIMYTPVNPSFTI